MTALAMSIMTGCTKGDSDDPVYILEESSLRLVLNVPVTKAALDEGDDYSYDNPLLHEGSDNLLDAGDLDFHFYDLSGHYIASATGTEKVSIDKTIYDPVTMCHRYHCDLKIGKIENGQQYRVVVIANKRIQFSNTMPFCLAMNPSPKAPSGFSGNDEQYLYSQLVFDTYSNMTAHNMIIPAYTMNNLNGFNEATIPMWGVQQLVARVLQNPDPEGLLSSGEIYLLRSLAKVKVILASELLQTVELTNYVQNSNDHGMVLKYTRGRGYMAPLYSDARASQTWNSKGMDKVGGNYSDVHVNAASKSEESLLSYAMPMYYDGKSGYFAYLPEQMIGEACVSMEFRYLDPSIVASAVVSKKLQFADYTEALKARGDLLYDVPLTDEQLKNFRYPIMRNNYYIYRIVRLDPLEVKFEVCSWDSKNTIIEFN